MSRYTLGEPDVHAWVERAQHADRFDVFLVQRSKDGVRFMTADGSFGDKVGPYNSGAPALVLPRATVGNLALAFDEFSQGLRPDARTEAKVLREALDLERRRVDEVLLHLRTREAG